MKKSLIFASLLMFAALSMSAQSVQWLRDPETGYDVPVGVCSWDDIQSSRLYELEMETFYKTYMLNMINVEDMSRVCKDVFPGYQMKAVFYFGGWNNDCQEMLPMFIRWAESLSIEYSLPVEYTLIGVDKSFTSNNGTFDAAHIQNVPTIQLTLFKKEGNVVVDEVKLGEFSGPLQEETLERELYLIFARYMKYSYGR